MKKKLDPPVKVQKGVGGECDVSAIRFNHLMNHLEQIKKVVVI